MAKIDCHYDKRADVLYLSFGQPRPSVGDEVAPGVVLLFDLKTDELSGVTFVDFAYYHSKFDLKTKAPEWKLPPEIVDHLLTHHCTEQHV